MKFNNSYEFANYFVTKETDSRRWPNELRSFTKTFIWKTYFWTMKDKYVRGHCVIDALTSAEYQACERDCISKMIDFIDHNTTLTFPLEYECRLLEASGGSAWFNVTCTPVDINQMSLFNRWEEDFVYKNN